MTKNQDPDVGGPAAQEPEIGTVDAVRENPFQRPDQRRPADTRALKELIGDKDAKRSESKQPNHPKQPKKHPILRWVALLGALVVAAGILVALLSGGDDVESVSLNEIEMLRDSGEVVEASMHDVRQQIVVELDDGTKLAAGYPESYGSDLYQSFADADIDVEVTGLTPASSLYGIVTMLLPILVIVVFLLFFTKRYMGGRSGAGKRGDPVGTPPNVRFSDVVGAEEATEDLREVVDFLLDPDRYSELGANPPKGVLMVGPPGTGKTLIAKAVAGEAGVPFFAMSGSDFVEMFVGVGASRVRSVFDKARKCGRAIIFIDEFDAVGKARGNATHPAHTENENTLNALLVEMDGFADRSVVVLAATNRPEILDPALLRPGRFDRQVAVSAPDRKGRTKLYELYLSNVKLDQSIDLHALSKLVAKRSPGMTGADISNVANEAALIAVREGAEFVSEQHVFEALERGALGRERRSIEVTEQARRITAYHEAGHTVCALVQPDALRPERVSIVPRGGAGGVTWFSGRDDEMFITRSQCLAELTVSFGGRAAEETILDGDYTQGAAGDIAHATNRATKMVCDWGMSDLGVVQLDPSRLMGETAERVRLEISRLCDEALAHARRILSERVDLFEAVAQALLEHETIDRDMLDQLLEDHSGDVPVIEVA